MSLLNINNLSAGYGEVDVLHGISMDIDEGELVAVGVTQVELARDAHGSVL